MSRFKEEQEVLFARGISNNENLQHANDKWHMILESTLNDGDIQVASLYPTQPKISRQIDGLSKSESSKTEKETVTEILIKIQLKFTVKKKKEKPNEMY